KLLFIPILIFSVIVHECAHGIAALRAGDPTAKMMGRITLNPVPHIDLFGSVIIPAFLLLSGSPILFGYAKPVPVNPRYFRNPRRDEITVSFAGPAANLILSFLFLILAVILVPLARTLHFSTALIQLLLDVLNSGILINLVLAFFNLIPIPPLDGSHILENVLPPRYAQYFAMIRPYGFFILILLFVTPLLDVIYIPVKIVYAIYVTILRIFI
ncbi:MAG TPA: site-2 protease family protein, partial [Bacteroidetes bacterium]|nr:site-2 protease family protein [Bacteroidota bacterium]